MQALGEAEAAFVENQGLFFERFGLPRIGGRILATLLLANEPATLDEIAALLKVSKASASTNLRHFVALGMVDIVTVLGDRKTYYQWSPQAWERRYDLVNVIAGAARSMAQQGLTLTGPDSAAARARFQETIAFADYMAEALVQVRKGWLERRAATRGHQA
jgi:predicted transcriptional regulator